MFARIAPLVSAAGGCLCGAVRFTVRGPIRRTVTACHCSTCRRFSGGLFAGTVIARSSLALERDAGLKWYQSSEHGRRGFCGECGASLFGETEGEPLMAISAAALDEPTGLVLATQSWISECADFWRFGPEVLLKDGPSGLGGPPEPVEP
jgi:hypothetical protein